MSSEALTPVRCPHGRPVVAAVLEAVDRMKRTIPPHRSVPRASYAYVPYYGSTHDGAQSRAVKRLLDLGL
jgi:hypothetical protein